MAIEALLGGEAEGLTRRAVEVAMQGDVPALRLCLERLMPARKDATVAFQLPSMQTTADAIAAFSAVADSVGAGEISPSEGAELGKIIDSFTRAIETNENAQQIRQWEQGRSRPLGAMRAYLMIIDRDPKQVLELLRAAPRRKAA